MLYSLAGHSLTARLTGALIDWTSTYTGDLAEEPVQDLFREILALVLRYPVISHLVQDLIDIEQNLFDIIDLDVSWSLKSTTSQSTADDTVPRTPASEVLIDSDVIYDIESLKSDGGDKGSKEAASASTHSISTSSLGLEETSGSGSQSQKSASEPRLISLPAETSPTSDYGFARWSHAFAYLVNSDARAFAVELTKMQWEVFKGIRVSLISHTFGPVLSRDDIR